jgi:hypothetical protein
MFTSINLQGAYGIRSNLVRLYWTYKVGMPMKTKLQPILWHSPLESNWNRRTEYSHSQHLQEKTKETHLKLNASNFSEWFS